MCSIKKRSKEAKIHHGVDKKNISPTFWVEGMLLAANTIIGSDLIIKWSTTCLSLYCTVPTEMQFPDSFRYFQEIMILTVVFYIFYYGCRKDPALKGRCQQISLSPFSPMSHLDSLFTVCVKLFSHMVRFRRDHHMKTMSQTPRCH